VGSGRDPAAETPVSPRTTTAVTFENAIVAPWEFAARTLSRSVEPTSVTRTR
jgi:hypothetical protein